MTAAPTTERASALLPGAHREVRAIDGQEAPFAGMLVTRGEGVAIRVDAAALSGWAGWSFGGSEHVLAPLDIVRRADGHDVLLPWCAERVSTFVARRVATSAALRPGEYGTLLVSLFRALEEIGRTVAAEGVRGAWWLTDDGRPVFVVGEGDEARAAVVPLIAQLRESCREKTLGRLLTAVEDGLRANIEQHQRRVPRLQLERWETDALEIAAPKPLRREGVPELRTMDAATANVRPLMEGATLRAPRATRRSTQRGRGGFRRARSAKRGMRALSAVFSALADVTRTSLEWARGLFRRENRTATRARTERVGSPLRPRRRALLVAAAAAVAVLAAGILWPSGATSEVGDAGAAQATAPASATSDGRGEATSRPRSPVEESMPSSGDAPVESSSTAADSEDPVVVTAALLEAIERCGEQGDDTCGGVLAPGSSAAVLPLADGSADAADIELIDEYGDIAVVRVTATSSVGGAGENGAGLEGGRMLVLVRLNEKWLVRDVYDVADQPE